MKKRAGGLSLILGEKYFVKAGAAEAGKQRSATPPQESCSLFPQTQARADVGLA
jgi:hypothetical protein